VAREIRKRWFAGYVLRPGTVAVLGLRLAAKEKVAAGSICANPPSNAEVFMNDQGLLDHVRVASPCNARWEDMAGDERARFCQHCHKHVFNLSELTRAEAEALIREKEGKLCGRFHRRRDGRMLTADCTVGRKLRQRRLLKRAAAFCAAITVFGAVLFASGSQRRNDGPRGALSQRFDSLLFQVKLKLGLIQPPMIVGMISVPLPPPTNSTSNPPAPTN